ncbi:MAG: DUF4268 domain-containing protein [Niabella sp.]
MYSRAEASAIRKAFWTAFGQYMKPIPNANGEVVNWVNYKTGIKHIYFRMDAGNKSASVSVEINAPEGRRNELYAKLKAMETVFNDMVLPGWQWAQNFYDEHGLPVSKIYTSTEDVNVMDMQQWPEIISFLKDNIIRLDEFWQMVKMQFEADGE